MVFSVGKHSYFPRNGGIDLAEFVWTQLGCRGQARGGASSLGRLYLQASSFPWLYGPGGGGKTAILQAIAEFLCTQFGPSQSFWAAFFFSRGERKGAIKVISVLTDRISTRSESACTTSTCLLYYGITKSMDIYHPFHNIPILIS